MLHGYRRCSHKIEDTFQRNANKMDALPGAMPEDDVYQTVGSANLDIGKFYLLLSALPEEYAYHTEVLLVTVEEMEMGPNGERQGVWYRRCRMLMESGEWEDMAADEPRRYAPLSILQGPEVPFGEFLPQGDWWHVMRFCVF